MSSSLLGQIERELKAATPGPWRIDGNGDIIQTNHTTRDVWYIPHKQEDVTLIAHAPAYIEAMLPVVKAALALWLCTFSRQKSRLHIKAGGCT